LGVQEAFQRGFANKRFRPDEDRFTQRSLKLNAAAHSIQELARPSWVKYRARSGSYRCRTDASPALDDEPGSHSRRARGCEGRAAFIYEPLI
jgi:hypothetical protein